MKKILAFILAFAMVFSLAACGGSSGGSAAQPEAAPAQAESAAAQAESAPAKAESTAAASEKAEAEPAKPAEVEVVEAVEEVAQSVIPCATGEIIRYETPTTGLKKEDPSTLYVGEMVVVENTNPGFSNSTACIDLMYDSLVRIDYDTGEYVGNVMESWEIADDAQSMTFTVAPNVTFHDGTTATAEDLIYSLWRLAQPELSPQADVSTFSNIDFDQSEATGELTGKLVFKTPMLTIIPSMLKSWILSKEHIEGLGEDNAWWENSIGTGPYKIESIKQGDRYNLVRNDDYWKADEKAAFEKAVVRYYAEASTMYMDFESGALDLIINPLTTDVARVLNGDINDAVCDIYPSLQTFCLGFNEEMNPVLADENVRKAIYYALDVDIVTKLAYDFLGVGADSIFANGVQDTYVRPHEQNIELAMQALSDAGYGPGELTLVFGTNTQNVNMALAEAVQAQIQEVGINVEIVTADPNEHISNFRNTGSQTYDFASSLVTYATLDCAPFLSNCVKSCNAMSFTAPTDDYVDELGLKIRGAQSLEEKAEATLALQEYIYDHYWMVPIVKTKTALIYKSYISGVRALTPRCPDLSEVYIVE